MKFLRSAFSSAIVFTFAFICGFQAFAASPRPLPFLNRQDLTPYWASEKNGEKFSPAKIDSFQLENQDKKAVTELKLKGKISVLHFFFGTCGTVCPVLIHNMRDVQKKLAKMSKLRFFSISVMPDEDTPELLKSYAHHAKINLKNWDLVTGAREEIFKLGRGTLKADQGSGESTAQASFVHSQNVYLIDGELKLRGIYDGGSPAALALLVKDAKNLEREFR